MIEIIVDKRQTLTAFGQTIPVSCLVRNELNETRGMNEVVYGFASDGSRFPTMPRPFPPGMWPVRKPIPKTPDTGMAPFFIPTDACQELDEWEVENRNGVMWYVKPTGRKIMDWGYGIHIYNGLTSNGCLHVEDSPGMTKEEALDWLVNEILKYCDGSGMYEKLEMTVTEP